MKKLMKLWGRGASAEDDKPEETDEEKEAREKAEKEEADRKAAEEAARAEASDEEDDDEEDDEETKKAAAAVPAGVRASIARAERARIHAIVDGAGRDRVETALHVAFNTSLGARAALGLIKAATGSAPAPKAQPAGGRLGLAADMASRRQPALGPAAAPDGAKSEEDKAVAAILKHATKAT